jgi:hypothetical protein
MMALISQFNAKHRDKYTTHKPIEADYYTIQLDRESARALFNILKEEFNFT